MAAPLISCLWSCLSRNRRSFLDVLNILLDRFLILALLDRTNAERPGLAALLLHIGTPALRAFLRNRAIPRDEVAIRIIDAAVKRLALLGAPLSQLPGASRIGTRHADRLVLHVFALRVRAARRKFAEAAVLEHQLAAALGTLFFQHH